MKRTDQYDPAALKHMEKEFDQWEQNEVSSFIKRAPESKTEYTTASGMPTKRTYTPLDLKNTPFEDIDRGTRRSSGWERAPQQLQG